MTTVCVVSVHDDHCVCGVLTGSYRIMLLAGAVRLSLFSIILSPSQLSH